jgi:8-oxo-dGTP diphosphatase
MDMGVRSTIKAIILDQGRILVNQCRDEHNGTYYALPGGGQNRYETMHEALVRECLEETGHTVEPIRFAALYEEICDDPHIRENYPEYAHKLLHIFICRLVGTAVVPSVETDEAQIGTAWVALEDPALARLLPAPVGRSLQRLIDIDRPLDLGSDHIPFNHG